MTRRHACLIILLALPAGCGGDEPTATVRDDRVAVRIQDFRYTPQTIRASAGNLRFTLTNRGRLAHTFRVSRANTTIAKVSSLLPGDRASKRVRVRKGEYRFFCALSNHEELGMYGTLIVK
ncbi:MAG: cupredoxin domain-containing protein [Actinomycetota bacterium]|nr:cupredoxin domain-containing protein [Actinomycetota bacterium]